MNLSRRSVLKSLPAVIAARPGPVNTSDAVLPALECEIGSARVTASGLDLKIETGRIERSWRLTENGLVTTSLRSSRTGREWTIPPVRSCDWSLERFGLAGTKATLIRLTARPVRYDPYTSDRLEVTAEFDYSGLTLRYTVWAYPSAPGLRTQLAVKGIPRSAASAGPAAADCLPIDCSRLARRAAGYYNNTQNRNSRTTENLREETATGPLNAAFTVDWANMVALESGGEGVCVVKESHKCVNQQGVETGAFEYAVSGLTTTGWGVGPADLLPERFRNAWATWTVVFDGGDDGRELALKVFDRFRYPIDPQRDIYTMSNTWGSTASPREAQNAACEENVLRQIDACRDLGIDVVQIDDGWQGSGYKHWDPAPERYPNGWTRVREAARCAGVKLGVWSAWLIDASDLKRNYDRAGFQYFKIDFANLNTYAKLETLVAKIRTLIEYSGQTVRVNWDVTENAPRMGYYFGREFGNIYLENRKPEQPANVVYVPYLVLRDAWHVSKYLNLNKFQISIQNLDTISRERSNAFRYNHPYAVAIALMATPLFFQEVTLYSQQARDSVRPLVATYKQHRRNIFRGYTFPIGEKPCDAAWTGFQNHDPASASGYVLLFRELNAPDATQSVRLRFLAGTRLRLTDLRSGAVQSVAVPADGAVSFEIAQAPDFAFFRYESEGA
jgi:hypothetical protein